MCDNRLKPMALETCDPDPLTMEALIMERRKPVVTELALADAP